MASTRFNANILNAARKLQDERTDPSSNGDSLPSKRRYSSAVLQGYQNRAIRELIFDAFKELGPAFGTLIPEYMKTSPVLTVTGAVAARPADAWIVTEAMNGAKTVKLQLLADNEIIDVTLGKRTLIVPTNKRPVFYQEGDSIIILPNPTTIPSIIARYIVVHQDITVNVSVSTDGNFGTAGGIWTASARSLQAAMNVDFAATDVGKDIMFKDGGTGIVYQGKIEEVTAADTVVISAGTVPAGSVPTIDTVLVGDVPATGSDILLKATWDSKIVDKMIQYAAQDASRNFNA